MRAKKMLDRFVMLSVIAVWGCSTPKLRAPASTAPPSVHCSTALFKATQGSLWSEESLLPDIRTLPLPSDYKDALRKHPIYKLREKFQDGKGLVFRIQYYKDYLESALGEHIQSYFLVDNLKEIFPKAKFKKAKEHVKQTDDLKIVQFNISDSAENELRTENINAPDFIDMLLLKPANPKVASIDGEVIRGQMGISREKHVSHLYMRDLEDTELQWHGLLHAVDSDIVFLSSRGDNTNRSYFEGLFKVTKESEPDLKEWELVFLSDLTEGHLKNCNKCLIFNDLDGQVPNLHAVSDDVIIVGPINFQEALVQGKNTAHLINRDLAIDPWAGAQMMDSDRYIVNLGQAQQNPHYAMVEDPSSLKSTLDALEQNRSTAAPALPPYLEPNTTGESAAEIFLDELEKKLLQQL